jgi:WD40 repeat protein
MHVLQGHFGSVRSVAFSPDGKRIVSGLDDTIQLWDAELGEVIGMPLQGHFRLVRSVAFSPDGRRVVSESFDRTIQLWDAESHEVIGKPLQGHSGMVSSVAFWPDATCVVSGSLDGTIRLWDAEWVIPPQGHSNLISALGDEHMAPGSGDNTVQVEHAQLEMTTDQPGHQSVSMVDFDTHFSSLFTDDCTLREDGWMTTPTEELLFWVPAENRVGFVWPRSMLVQGADTNRTRINLRSFACGLEWENCRKPS